MSAPSSKRRGTVPRDAVENPEGGRLVFRWRGSIGLVGQRGAAADTRESRVFDALPQVPGVAALVVSGTAVSDPGLPAALWEACGKLFGGPTPHQALWLVMPGAGRPDAFGKVYAQIVADSFGAEVIAPAGELAIVARGSAFAVGAAGAAGWNRFRRGVPSDPVGYRLPPQSWEAMLPELPLFEKDLVFEHVPAGLLVRNVRSRPSCQGDPAWDVPMDARRPRVVLGRPGEDELPHAQLVAGLRRLPPQLPDVAWFVPGATGTHVAAWAQRLAESLGRSVVVTPGVPAADGSVVVRNVEGGQAWPTMPTLLRYSPGSQAEVLDAAPPPPGWVADGALNYRPVAGQRVRLRVVPAGLVMTGPDDTDDPAAGPFEPHRMTIAVTSSAAAEGTGPLRHLLGWFAQRCGVRILAVGVQEDRLRDELHDIARESGVELDLGSGPVAGEPPRGAEKVKSIGESTVVIPVPATARPVTLSSGPSTAPSSGIDEPPTVQPDARITTVRAAPHDPPLLPGGHVSSEGERAAFLAWAADEFNDAVGVVNAALALLPALRGNDETAARVDLVAVRLYLGASARGGAALNEALREQRVLPCSEYLACLTSGLRRLPVQRGPVFRQSSWSWQQDVRDAYPLGEVLSEPGLLSAVPKGECVAADLPVDFGIWSRTARRTSALATAGENEELVFCQRSRFKVLDVDDNADARPAVLLGELAADEKGGTGKLTEHDLAVAEKLREALRLRRAVEPSTMGEVQASRFQSPVGLVAGAVVGQSISATAS
ncbi:hypothetical protein [Saccharopolyspora sp. NPDC002376]